MTRSFLRRWRIVIVPTVTLVGIGAVSSTYNVWSKPAQKLEGPVPNRATALYVTGAEQTTIYELSSRSRWMLRFVTACRAIYLLWVVIPLISRYAFAVFYSGTQESLTEAHKALGKRLATLGPTYVKLGQWLAMRGDVIPAELAGHLTPLLNNSPPHSWSESERILKDAEILDKFSSIEKEPLGSGTIAQVHLAVLKEPVDDLPAGTKLLLKIRHPGGKELMLADLLVLTWGARFAQLFVPSLRFLWPEQSIAEFSAMLISQMDLVREADNLMAFRYYFQKDPHVVFPIPLPHLCSEEVLVETFEFGQRIPSLGTLEHSVGEGKTVEIADDTEKIAVQYPIHKTLGPVATNMFLRMLFEFNLIHADLHPGNVLHRYKLSNGEYTMEKPRKGKRFTVGREESDQHNGGNLEQDPVVPQLVILDPGLVVSLTDEDRHHVFMLMTAIMCADGPLAAKLLLDRGAKIGSHIKPELLPSFEAEMQEVVEGFNPNAGTMKETQITELIGAAMQAMRHHSVRVDMNFASLLETLALGDACARVIAPRQNIFHDSAPFLWKFLKKEEFEALASTLVKIYYPSSGAETAKKNFFGLFVGMGRWAACRYADCEGWMTPSRD